MGLDASTDEAAAFKRFEAAGWTERADSYGALIARATALVAEHLLDAARVSADMRVLDVACGPGHISAAIAGRGAHPLGIDISAGMLDVARAAHPGLDFAEGDAEALPADAGPFDAVVGGFVMNHLPSPERAAAEAVRVLRPGGRAAFSVWDRPERTRLIGLLGEAVERAGGDRMAAVPAGPDGFRFADPDEFRELLERAGLHRVAVETRDITVLARDTDELWEGMLGGCVRAGEAVLAHPPSARERIRHAFDELAAEFALADGLSVPATVLIASGESA
jgi:ubiquinone/menaquinone biosynthesis C-methylase UbiE